MPLQLDQELIIENIKIFPVLTVDGQLSYPLQDLNIEFVDSLEEGSLLCLPWTITKDFIEDGPENAYSLPNRYMSIQVANDLADLVLFGDRDQLVFPLLHVLDGIKKQEVFSSNMNFKIEIVSLEELNTEEKDIYCLLKVRVELDKIN